MRVPPVARTVLPSPGAILFSLAKVLRWSLPGLESMFGVWICVFILSIIKSADPQTKSADPQTHTLAFYIR